MITVPVSVAPEPVLPDTPGAPAIPLPDFNALPELIAGMPAAGRPTQR